MDSKEEVKEFLVSLCRSKQQVNIFQAAYVYRGILENYESVQNSLRITLNRSFNLLAGNEIEIHFEVRPKFYFITTRILAAVGQRITIPMPDVLVSHLTRGAPRYNVEHQEILCRVSFPPIPLAQLLKSKTDEVLQDQEMMAVYHEMATPLPKLNVILDSIRVLIARRVDQVEIVLGNVEQLFAPARIMFERMKRPLHIHDATDVNGLLSRLEDSVLYSIFADYLELEMTMTEEEKHGRSGAMYWAQYFHDRNVLSETFIPIFIQQTLAGWIRATIFLGSAKRITEQDVYFFMSMSEIIAEALIVRTLNARGGKEGFTAKLVDVSETGLRITVSDPIFAKLLRPDSVLRIGFPVLGKPISLAVKVVRSFPGEEKGRLPGFTMSLDHTKTASHDKVWYRRFINKLQTEEVVNA
jgi:hypothetical protein